MSTASPQSNTADPRPGTENPRPRSTGPRAPARRIVRLFRPYRWSLLFVGVLVGASSLVSLVNPFLIRAVIDTALPQRQMGLLTVLAAAMIVVSIANSSFSVSQTYVSTKVGQRVMHDLRTAVYSHLQRMSLAFFTRTRTGEVQSRIANDIGGMQATVTTTATSLVSNLTTVVASVIAMVVLDWRLTVASLIMLPFFVWVSRRVGTERRRITRDRQRQLALMSSVVQESLSVGGILLGHTMGRSTGFSLAESFATESGKLSDLEIRSSMAGRWRQSTIQIVMPAVIYWVTGLTAGGGRGTAISIGTLVAFTTLQQQLFRPMVNLLSVGVDIQSSLELFGRIFEYLDLPVDIAEPPHPVTPARLRGEVQLHDVGFCYTGVSPGGCGPGALLAGRLLLVVPGEGARFDARLRRDAEGQDQGAAGYVRAVRAGVVQRAVVMDGATAGRERARDRLRDVGFVHLQTVDAGIVVDAVVGQECPPMTARHELHTAVFQRGRLEGYPHAEGVVIHHGVPVGFILVPGCGRADVRRLEDRVVAHGTHLRPQQLPGHSQRIDTKQTLFQFGRVLAGDRIFRQGRLPVLLVRAGQIELVALLASGAHGEQAVVDVAHPDDLLLRGDGIQCQIAFTMVEVDLVLRQDDGGHKLRHGVISWIKIARAKSAGEERSSHDGCGAKETARSKTSRQTLCSL